MDERLGAVLRGLREARGWSLSYVGEISGTSGANISKIERGRAKEYSLALLSKLAEAYGLRLCELFALVEAVELASKAMGSDEAALLEAYRSMSAAQRETLMSVALTLRPVK
jgi:transcriptional regulator with XRE-family HTH domain